MKIEMDDPFAVISSDRACLCIAERYRNGLARISFSPDGSVSGSLNHCVVGK